nr:unnamed protein product [Callosobruchus analis]
MKCKKMLKTRMMQLTIKNERRSCILLDSGNFSTYSKNFPKVLLNSVVVFYAILSKEKLITELKVTYNHSRRFKFTLNYVSSRIDISDLNWEKRRYNCVEAYEQSKLANVLFTKELSRRLRGKVYHHIYRYIQSVSKKPLCRKIA